MVLLSAVARRTGNVSVAVCRWAGSLSTASAPRLAVQQNEEHDVEQQRQPRVPQQRYPWAAAAPPPAAARRNPAALAVVQPGTASLLQRTLDTAASALHRLLVLVGSLRRLSASEAYVRRYLEQHVGLDTFSLEYLHISSPQVFRLSVARDIEPAISWLRSIGINGAQLAELIRHTPAILSVSVDEQLEPLAAFIQQAGGSPAAVLLTYPGIAAVPVAHLKGTRHVLRQLGVTDEDLSLMLLSMPDLYAQLAETLQRLFTDFSIAAWGLQRRQRLQFAEMVHHHMAHWNRGTGRLAAVAAAAATRRHGRHPRTASGESSSSGGDSGDGAEFASSSASRPHLRRSQLIAKVGGSHRQHGRAPAGAGHPLGTSYVLDRGVYQGLVRVQAALETLSLQEEQTEEWEAAVGQLQHAIDLLGKTTCRKEGEEGARAQLEAAA